MHGGPTMRPFIPSRRRQRPPAESDNTTCLGVLQPLLGDDLRPRQAHPPTPRITTLANVLKDSAHYLSPSRRPTNVSIWSAYRGESSAYTRHPACTHVARLVQLNVNICAGLCAGAVAAPHSSGDAGTLTCTSAASVTGARCPAMPVPTRS